MTAAFVFTPAASSSQMRMGVYVLKPEECEAVMTCALENKEAQVKIIEEMLCTGIVHPKVKLSK